RRRRARPDGLRRRGGAPITARPGGSPAGPVLFGLQGDAAPSGPAGRGDPDPAPPLLPPGVREGRFAARPGDREGRAGRHPLWRRVAGGGGERRAHHPPLPGGRATARDRRGARGPRGSPPRDRAGRRSHRRHPLEREPVEDLRIDLGDGFGSRSDQEEDEAARAAGAEVAAGLARRSLPSFLGIRIKPLAAQGAARAARTLELFVTSLVERSRGKLPATFTVTLPKVAMLEEVTALVRLL